MQNHIKSIENGGYNTLFVGSSRVLSGLNPSYILPQFKAYNAGVPVGTYYDFQKLTKSILRSNIKTIVWGLDFGTGSEGLRKQDYIVDNKTKTKIKILFGTETILDSIQTMESNILKKYGATFFKNGFIIPPPSKNPYEDAQKSLLNVKNQESVLCSSNKEFLFKKELFFLEWLIKKSIEKKINLYLFLPPVHYELYRLDTDGCLREIYQNWIKNIVKVLYENKVVEGNLPKLEIWAFNGYNSITTESLPTKKNNKPMKWYIDVSHFRENVGNMILDRILHTHSESYIPNDFGIQLTPENLKNMN